MRKRAGGRLACLVGLIRLAAQASAQVVSRVVDGDIDCTTPAGKLQLHILAALAEFERGRIRERVMAGLQRARAQGTKLGRPHLMIASERLRAVRGMPVREAARVLGVPRSTAQRWLALSHKSP